jgi:hypothetical protein
MSTKLFQNMIAYDYENAELMRAVWTPTPWMVDVHDRGWDEDHGRSLHEIFEWCNLNLGTRYDYWSRRDGRWQRGNVTICGWTWYGFATEEMMRRFCERFETRNEEGAANGGKLGPNPRGA